MAGVWRPRYRDWGLDILALSRDAMVVYVGQRPLAAEEPSLCTPNGSGVKRRSRLDAGCLPVHLVEAASPWTPSWLRVGCGRPRYSELMLRELAVTASVSLRATQLRRFVLDVADGYRPNPFHAFHHGFHVMQQVYGYIVFVVLFLL